MNQSELTSIFCARPQNFVWFLGAGASRSAGLPTATDIIWDLKRRHYSREENQEILRQDIQNESVRSRIQSYMDSMGFPSLWADEEYVTYFEKIFGDDIERQRKYLGAILSEENVALSIGNRVLGGLISSGLCRMLFTTNFDSVVEKSVAEVGQKTLSTYHLEGAHNAIEALNNEEFPIYCKLHGDFRFDSLKNLPDDLATQNSELSKCLINAGNRYGFIVSGYSGRDKSIMDLFNAVLETENPFPHGLFWTGIKGSSVHTEVKNLLEKARGKGINAQHVSIETFDSFLLRLWRNIENKDEKYNKRVYKSEVTDVNISLPPAGKGKPLLRLNALPIISSPAKCQSLSLHTSIEWSELREASFKTERNLIFTKSDSVLCWGQNNKIRQYFKDDLVNISSFLLPNDLGSPENLHIKGFIEEALCLALVRNKPLLTRTTRNSSFLIVDRHADDKADLDPLFNVIGKESGIISGLYAPLSKDNPNTEQVSWAEAIRISIELKDGQLWMLIDPDIWIWPPRARRNAVSFMEKLRGDRFNKKFNEIIDAWISVIFGMDKKLAEITVSSFDTGSEEENPSFHIGRRTAFSRRLL